MEASRRPIKYLRHLVSAPFIYGLIVPLLIMDICVEVYHRVCFPLYSIEYVRRSQYIRVDRHKLSYLNWIEKMNCMYCGYANGLAHYLTTIAGETEKYWCGVKHKNSDDFKSPVHHKDFLKYGDKKGFDKFLKK